MADISISFDMRRLMRALDGAAETIATGAKRGLHDALDEWQAESTDIAPLDKGTLRRGFKSDISNKGRNLVGEVTVNATEKSRKHGRFNYAYYIHEQDAGGKSLRTPGTEKKFLEIPLKENEDKWLADIERQIQAELKRKGW